MKQGLLKYLNCPTCKGEIVLTDFDNHDEIMTGKLTCSSCHAVFLISNGVPIFTKNGLNNKAKLTVQNFTYAWKRCSRTDKNFYKKQFFDWISPIKEEFFNGKVVLDAGCGKGHHLLMVSSYIKEGIGIDISDSVFIAHNNVKHLGNIHIIKADVNNLPLKDEIFEYVYSIGVVHHTESPQITTQNLYKKLKQNSLLSLWIYGKENNWWIIYIFDPLRKLITSFLPPQIIHLLSTIIALFLILILKLIYLPVSRFNSLALFRKLLFYYPYFSYICEFDFNEIDAIVFDHLVAPISHYLSKNDVENLINSNSKIKIEAHNKNSWRAQITKCIS